MERDIVLHGVRTFGNLKAEDVWGTIEDRCISKGMNYTHFSLIDFDKSYDTTYNKELLFDWVRKLVENEIYFSFWYEHRTDDRGKSSELACGVDRETLLEIKKIAGKYFIGTIVPELGSEYGCYASDYKTPANTSDNMKDAHDKMISSAKGLLKLGSVDGQLPVSVIEATALLPYIAECNLAFPTLEAMCGNPEIMLPLTRGTASAMKNNMWATYIAHEWYGGVRVFDTLKMHRLRMIYDYCYMSGSNLFVLESGIDDLFSHDTAPGSPRYVEGKYDANHPICKEYVKVLSDFAKFIKEDARPVGGPKVKVAFVQGNLDGYSPWRAGSSLWNCFNNKDFGYSAPEFMWRIFDDINVKRNWGDVSNYGDIDLSGAPAYGTYDIINAKAGYEAFSKYEYLIFTGWNSMTEEIYADLKKYVENGGKLFMTAAHLNTSIRRDGEMKLINDGDVSDLFGCKLSVDEKFCVNHGYKCIESIIPELMYPADLYFDPLFSEGYVNYAKTELTTAVSTGKLSQNFVEPDIESMPIWLTENKLGKGYAILMTSIDYPSASGFTAYKTVVREILTSTHRNCDIKVYGGDRLRFSVYEGNKVYLLNTDFNSRTEATIDYGIEKKTFLLEPRQLLPVEA